MRWESMCFFTPPTRPGEYPSSRNWYKTYKLCIEKVSVMYSFEQTNLVSLSNVLWYLCCRFWCGQWCGSAVCSCHWSCHWPPRPLCAFPLCRLRPFHGHTYVCVAVIYQMKELHLTRKHKVFLVNLTVNDLYKVCWSMGFAAFWNLLLLLRCFSLNNG